MFRLFQYRRQSRYDSIPYIELILPGWFLVVGGRSKEIIVAGGGEKVAPIPIEEAIKVG
jgi:hypothetical protein